MDENIIETPLPKVKSNFEIIQELLDLIYPDNSEIVEISSITGHSADCGYSFTKSVIIHFPHTEITNGDISRSLQDIYVRIDMDPNARVMSRLAGIRTTFTIEEYDSHYSHSHLQKRRGEVWGKFCLGSTDMQQSLLELSSEFNPVLFESFLYRIKTYLQWESLTGGPHIRMESIRLQSTSSMINSLHSTYLGRIRSKLGFLPIVTQKNKFYNYFSVDTSNLEFEKEVSRLALLEMQEGGEPEINRYFIKKDTTNNRYFSDSNESPSDLKRRIEELNESFKHESLFLFKGNTIKRSITSEVVVGEEVDSSIITVLPESVFKGIAMDLENDLNKYLNYKTIKNNYESKYNTTGASITVG